MTTTTLGIIEGFYGRLYTTKERLSLMSFIAKTGYSYYIYAPKNDASLRRRWHENFTPYEANRLLKMSAFAHEHHLDFGIGLSPLAITSENRQYEPILYKKTEYALKNLKARIIAVLFDDIKLYEKNEGQAQNRIISSIYEMAKDYGARVIFCPTYYSFDPILEKIFGPCPPDYFQELTHNLDEHIEVFWTGNKVLSKEITPADIEKITALLGRRVTLWDNYPVNDGKKISTKIYTRPFFKRAGLDGIVLSHAVNPMLECTLNKIALSTLPLVYKDADDQQLLSMREQTVSRLFKMQGQDLCQLLVYLDALHDDGLESFDEHKKNSLLTLLETSHTKAADEIRAFFRGVYAFDPACLTS